MTQCGEHYQTESARRELNYGAGLEKDGQQASRRNSAPLFLEGRTLMMLSCSRGHGYCCILGQGMVDAGFSVTSDIQPALEQQEQLPEGP